MPRPRSASNLGIGRARNPQSISLCKYEFEYFSDVLGLKAEDLASFRGHPRSQARYSARQDIVQTEGMLDAAMLLEEGWAMRLKLLSDGRRQIINLYLPGDPMCLDAAVNEQADCTITALTHCTVTRIEIEKFSWGDSTRLLALAFLRLQARNDRAMAEHIVSLGRRSAIERTAYFLVELARRVDVSYGRGNLSYQFPITQGIIADVLGLSNVHVNRTLRTLQERGFIRLKRGSGMTLHVLNVDGLVEAANC